jgi:hypothetical protein
VKDIDAVKGNLKFKLSARNILGVRHQDDWIFNLNIGNVMHLATMSIEELVTKLDSTHELNRDAMLEKIVLITVACFCLSTELRFIAMVEDHANDPVNHPPVALSVIERSNAGSEMTKSIRMKRKSSELWHIKAVRIGCTFLPPDCPLVQHSVNNFKKHHEVIVCTNLSERCIG